MLSVIPVSSIIAELVTTVLKGVTAISIISGVWDIDMEFHELGFIKGGLCEKRLQRRRERAIGCRMAWDDIKNNPEYVKYYKGWYKIIKVPDERKDSYSYGGTEQQNNTRLVGYLRMIQDVYKYLKKEKKKFRLSWMENWIEAVASYEFIFTAKDPLTISGFKRKPPKGDDDYLYSKLHGVPTGLFKCQ